MKDDLRTIVARKIYRANDVNAYSDVPDYDELPQETPDAD